MNNQTVIRSKEQHQAALKRVDELLDMESPSSAEQDELDLLGVLISNYENQHFPLEAPDPLEAIKFRMEQQGLKASDLVPYLGAKSRVSEILSGKRELSKNMIYELSRGLDIPADILLGLRKASSTNSKKTAILQHPVA